jgi:hypothetical protein
MKPLSKERFANQLRAEFQSKYLSSSKEEKVTGKDVKSFADKAENVLETISPVIRDGMMIGALVSFLLFAKSGYDLYENRRMISSNDSTSIKTRSITNRVKIGDKKAQGSGITVSTPPVIEQYESNEILFPTNNARIFNQAIIETIDSVELYLGVAYDKNTHLRLKKQLDLLYSVYGLSASQNEKLKRSRELMEKKLSEKGSVSSSEIMPSSPSGFIGAVDPSMKGNIMSDSSYQYTANAALKLSALELSELLMRMDAKEFEKEILDKWNYGDLVTLIFKLKERIPVFYDEAIFRKSVQDSSIQYRPWVKDSIGANPLGYMTSFSSMYTGKEKDILAALRSMKNNPNLYKERMK